MAASREEVLREFVRHRSVLFAMILSIVRDFGFAEEVLQEVAVVLLDQWADFTPGTHFQAWSMRIARNKILNLGRAARREILLSPDAMEAIERAAASDSRSGWLEALRQCLADIEGRSRDILVLRYTENLAGEEIARRLKTTVAAVHMALSRARSAVGRCVEGRLAQGEGAP